MTLMRLQKYLSSAGACSRRQGEKLIQMGRVKVNDVIIRELGTKVIPGKDRILLDGKPVIIKENRIYIILNKPKNYVTSCHHPGEKTVMDLIDITERVYPVGRLDKDSTGLILLTNDGSSHHRLLHPSFDHEKEYEVTTVKSLTDSALQKMEKGLSLMGKKTRPTTIIKESKRKFRIILKEGRNRQIRKMVRKVGGRVKELKRIRISTINLGNLAIGEWRYLTEKEKKSLLYMF